MNSYDHTKIERKWQERWERDRVFATGIPSPDMPAEYILTMFPYPSASGLHVGHMLGYTGTDVLARYARMTGKAVLHPMGWDAFGLPAENYALKTGVHPAVSTKANIAEYRRQFSQTGISYDWEKQVTTSDPEYYRWTQWLFGLLYKRGLAYRKSGLVNWCPKDQTVLANEQVVQGACERCGTLVVQKELTQWYFKITDYAERLLTGLEGLDWPERIKAMQRNWIGKSEGAQLHFALDGHEGQIDVFTTRPDTLFGVSYLVLAPEHSLVAALTTPEQMLSVKEYQEKTAQKSELERQFLSKEKSGVFTGAYALHPLTKERLPIWIADYVIASYGTGAVMAVPAHDERDFAFAQTFNLPIRQVIAPQLVQEKEPAKYRPDQPVVTGESIIALIKHPTEETYIALDWKESAWGAKTLLTGTIDAGSSPEETVLREIREETGYTNAKINQKLGVIDGLFYHLPKQTNKLVRAHVFLVQLENEDKGEIEQHEASRHELSWRSADELVSFLTPETHIFVLRWLTGFQPYAEKGALVNSGGFDGRLSDEVIAELVDSAGGELVTTYRLRDWLVSRQRYWGVPIPISYSADGTEHLLPESELPLELPIDVAFSPTGRSPLADQKDWLMHHDAAGVALTREADTLDTFVCSSWYFLRYPNTQYTDGPFDPEAVRHWLPVNTYIGGAEHAVLHLLYARFFTMVLHDAGMIDFDEPFLQLRNQGSILGPDHAKMSKSKGNVINPDEVIAEYGADTLRCFELFMGPFDQEKPWSTTGIIGIRRFLEKVWRLQERLTEAGQTEAELTCIHPAIAQVTADIPQMKFNTALAGLMEATNSLQELPTFSSTTYRQLLLLLAPFAPHIVEELWAATGGDGYSSRALWPVAQEEYLKVATWECPVQVNGKVRLKLQLPTGLTAAELEAEIRANAEVAQVVTGLTQARVIALPGKLVSIVTQS
jgi:leucyl-tRNA synthetase